jgi:hypothetical protein
MATPCLDIVAATLTVGVLGSRQPTDILCESELDGCVSDLFCHLVGGRSLRCLMPWGKGCYDEWPVKRGWGFLEPKYLDETLSSSLQKDIRVLRDDIREEES